jgi:uncharacterized delta-60 repeat protein
MTKTRFFSGSALVTALVISAVLLAFLSTLFSLTENVLKQGQRETRLRQAIQLGQSGINHGLAQLRLDPTYTGETYDSSTGTTDIFVARVSDTDNNYVVTAQSNVPDKYISGHICREYRAQVDPTVVPLQIIKTTYEELGTCSATSGSAPTNSAPTLTISKPDGTEGSIAANTKYNITYTLDDPENVVHAEFFYDTNNSGYDGTAIAGGCAVAPEGTNVTCSWDTTGMTPGSYYVYGIADDGTAAPTKVYSSGTMTITTANARPSFSISDPDGVNDTIASGSTYTITYTLTDPDSVAIAYLSYTKQPGTTSTGIATCFNVPEGTNVTCSWNTTGITNGNYYIIGIAVDGVNDNFTASSAGYVTITGNPANTGSTLTINKPDGTEPSISAGTTYNIKYTLSDPDDVRTVAFSYDTNNTGFDGSALSGPCSVAPEGTNVSCAWDTTGVTPGSYYVYGVVADGTKVYSSGKITITTAPSYLSDDAATSVVRDTSGNLYVLGYRKLFATSDAEYIVRKYNSSGTLQTAFGTNGMLVLGGQVSGTYGDLAIDGSNNIYFAGNATTISYSGSAGSTGSLMLKKFNTNGTIDTTFDGNVYKIVNYYWGLGGQCGSSGGTLQCVRQFPISGEAVELDGSGNVYVAGYGMTRNSSGKRGIVVHKFDSSGHLCNGSEGCTAWNTNGDTFYEKDVPIYSGATTTTPSGIISGHNTFKIDSSGNLYLAGTEWNDYLNGTNEMVLLKYTSAGTLDTSFDSDGKLMYNSGTTMSTGLAFDASAPQKVYAFGSRKPSSTIEYFARRYSSTGTLDTAWNTTGDKTLPSGVYNPTKSSSNIFVYSSKVNKYNSTAGADTSWASTGSLTPTITTVYDLIEDGSGNVYIAGSKTNTDKDFVIQKYTSAGSLDTTFGASGTATYTSP